MICVALLASCSVATHEEAVQSITTGEKRETLIRDQWAAAAGSGLVDDGWLKSFNDPLLMELVDEAQNNNLGLKIASAQVEQAAALTQSAGAALKPTVGLSGGYSDSTLGNSGGTYGAGLSIAWEADVWGRVRSGVARGRKRRLPRPDPIWNLPNSPWLPIPQAVGLSPEEARSLVTIPRRSSIFLRRC